MQILRLSILQLKFAYQNSLSLDPEIAYSLEQWSSYHFNSDNLL